MKRSSTSTKQNLLLLAITTLLGLLLMEFTLRFASPIPTVGVGTTETSKAKIYGWAPPSGKQWTFVNPDNGEVSLFTLNSQGWKDVEHQFDKPEDVIRILFIGDSFTFGYVPLNDLYTRQVERLLKKQGFSNTEVISIGVGGWGTDQALEALQVEGIKYQPDIVVYQFTGNDIADNVFPREGLKPNAVHWKKLFRYELTNGNLEKIKLTPKIEPASVSTMRKMKNILLKSALVYNIYIVKNKTIDYLTMRKDSEKGEPAFEAKKKDHWWDQYPANPLGPYFGRRVGKEPETLQKAWKLFEALVVKMKWISEKNNAKFVVFSEEGDNGIRIWSIKWNRIQTDGASDFVFLDGKKYTVDWKRPLKNLEKITKRYGIPLIKPVRQYDRYDYDPHPNKIGNERMAQDVVDFLIQWKPFYKTLNDN